MQQTLTIKIPVDLAENTIWQRSIVNKYETNKVIRAVDTWLCLKSTTTTGVIQWYDKQLPELLQLCKVSRASFYSRLKYLHTQKLLVRDKKNKRITLCSWDVFRKQFDITNNEFITLTYNLNDKRKIYQFLSAIEIDNNQQKQLDALHNRINKNPELKHTILSLMLEAGADRKQLDNANYFQKYLWQMQRDSFKMMPPGTAIYEDLHSIRADINRGVKALQSAYKCRSAQTISYLKNCLHKAGIISVEKIQVLSRVRARKKQACVRWLAHKKQTMWFACDQLKTIPGTEPVLVRITT